MSGRERRRVTSHGVTARAGASTAPATLSGPLVPARRQALPRAVRLPGRTAPAPRDHQANLGEADQS